MARRPIPRMEERELRALVVVLGALVLALGACGDGNGRFFPDLAGSGRADPATQSFANGGTTLTAATTTESSNQKTTIVTNDSTGATVLTMAFTTGGVSLSFPGIPGTTEITFHQPLQQLPTNSAVNRLATLIAGELVLQYQPTQRPDDPGCDWFPDTNCTLGCCAQHDQCYSLNGCSWRSWLPGGESAACRNCNAVAVGCITLACEGLIDSAATDHCYDHACDRFFDCPDGRCDCASPCAGIAPESCGNGTCEVDESAANCVADCSSNAGNNANQCCLESSGCPSETPDTCPGNCCCCGIGETCSLATNLCAPGDNASSRGIDGQMGLTVGTTKQSFRKRQREGCPSPSPSTGSGGPRP